MKKFLQNKKGVTLLEGLIALLLLAMVATGAFAVLLSNSRRATQPDIREEMMLAVNNAHEMLTTRMYAANADGVTGLCGKSVSSSSKQDIGCLLPVVCDRTKSSFYYTIADGTDTASGKVTTQYEGTKNNKQITFEITCNGFTL